jgi:hypothetical protein
MRKFKDRFIRAHGFLYIVRGMPGNYFVFANRKAVWHCRAKTIDEARKNVKRHAIARLRYGL